MIKISKYSVPTSDSRVSNLFNIHTSLSFQRNNDRTQVYIEYAWSCLLVYLGSCWSIPGPKNLERKNAFQKERNNCQVFFFFFHIQSCEHWKLQSWSSIEFILIHVFNAVILGFLWICKYVYHSYISYRKWNQKGQKTYKPYFPSACYTNTKAVVKRLTESKSTV